MTATATTGTLVNRFSYSYNGAGRRTVVLGSDGSRTSYAYDPVGQLVRELRTGGPVPANATFTYDPGGNRTRLVDSGQVTTSTFDAGNQFVRDVTSAGRNSCKADVDKSLLEVANENEALLAASGGRGCSKPNEGEGQHQTYLHGLTRKRP